MSTKDIQDTRYKIQNTKNGQAVLIVMLVMVVALTIGLAIVSRTTTDIKISQQQEESARAFSAAEAGIEEALRSGGIIGGPVTLDTGASYTSTVSETGYAEFLFPDEIKSGEVATLWLNGHDGSGNFNPTAGGQYGGSSFDLCWDGEAVEVSVYYKNGSSYEVKRGAYDPAGRGGFSSALEAGSCSAYPDLDHRKTISFSGLGVPGGSTLLFATIKPYYGPAKIGVVASGSPLPSQGQEIESTGSVGTITRKVRVFRAWPAPAAVFDYGVFSGGGLQK